MADLRTNYKDDVLNTSVNTKRKYNMIQNADGTVSFDDVTTYTQNGDSFGAKDVNDTNTAVNVLNENLAHKTNAISGTYDEGNFVTVDSIGYDKENKKLCLKVEGADTVIPFSGGGIYQKIIKVTGTYMKNNTLTVDIIDTNNLLFIDWKGSTSEKLAIDGAIILSKGTNFATILKPTKSTVSFSLSGEIGDINVYEVTNFSDTATIIDSASQYGGSKTFTDIKKGDIVFAYRVGNYIWRVDTTNIIIPTIYKNFRDTNPVLFYQFTEDVSEITFDIAPSPNIESLALIRQ